MNTLIVRPPDAVRKGYCTHWLSWQISNHTEHPLTISGDRESPNNVPKSPSALIGGCGVPLAHDVPNKQCVSSP